METNEIIFTAVSVLYVVPVVFTLIITLILALKRLLIIPAFWALFGLSFLPVLNIALLLMYFDRVILEYMLSDTGDKRR